MAIDIVHENLITLSAATRAIPGRLVSRQTLHRWCVHGIRGVRLALQSFKDSIGAMVVVAAVSICLTCLGPFIFERAVNPYFNLEDKDANQQLREYRWDVYGGWYILYEKHPAWPEIQIPAEFRFNPAGFCLSVLLWSAIVGWIWWTSWLITSIIREWIGKRTGPRIQKL